MKNRKELVKLKDFLLNPHEIICPFSDTPVVFDQSVWMEIDDNPQSGEPVTLVGAICLNTFVNIDTNLLPSNQYREDESGIYVFSLEDFQITDYFGISSRESQYMFSPCWDQKSGGFTLGMFTKEFMTLHEWETQFYNEKTSSELVNQMIPAKEITMKMVGERISHILDLHDK